MRGKRPMDRPIGDAHRVETSSAEIGGGVLARSAFKSMKLTAGRRLTLGFLSEIPSSPRHEQPVVEVEHDGGMILAVGALAGPRLARAVLGGDGAHAHCAYVVAIRQRRL